MGKLYRKKPVVIEAIQYNGENKVKIQHFMGRYLDALVKGLKIPTLEGDMFASVGDYIIKGVKGEFYPCKPDIFDMTYEVVDQPMTNADRIRAMSDEELTTFLNKIVVNHHIKNVDNCNRCPMKGARPCDTEGIIDWLKQPAEEVHKDA